MQRSAIPFEQFDSRIFQLFDRQWMLLTSGDFAAGQFNTMTISWGSMGIMWNRPFVQVVVRPQRYTFEFMERYETFSLSAFPKGYRKALNILGTQSGREGDKIASSGLTPVASDCIAAPAFEQAELVFECRKIYWQDYNPANFIDPQIDRNYPIQDYHRAYFGEILAIQGVERFRLSERS